MQPVDYSCLLPPTSLIALETIRTRPWDRVEIATPVLGSTSSIIRTGQIRIRGVVDVVVTAWPVDVIRKLEAFRLHAHIASARETTDRRFRGPTWQDAGEMLSAFHGSIPQMLVGARRDPAPEGALDGVKTILVEDLLILRHPSGQQAIIAADDNLPGSLIVAREMEHIPNNDAEIAYLRLI